MLSAERVSATDGDRRLSDHDAYLVEVSPDPPRGDQAGRGAVPPDVRQARQEDMLEMQCSEANPEEPEGWGRIECARVTMPPSRRLFSCFAAIQLRGSLGDMTAQRQEDHEGFHGYVGVQRRGLIALPADLRQRLHLDEPGAQLEVTERADGVIELRPALPVPADQAWFWTEHWQQREREVDEHVAAGRVEVHDSGEDFLAHLDNLDAHQ